MVGHLGQSFGTSRGLSYSMPGSAKLVINSDQTQDALLRATNSALEDELAKATVAKEATEAALLMVEDEFALLSQAAAATTAAIQSKYPCIAAVQRWKSIRTARPANFRTRDPVEETIDQLLGVLDKSVKRLSDILAEEQVMLSRLDASRKAAQANIGDKQTGLVVDGSTHALGKQYTGGHQLPNLMATMPKQPGLTPSAWSSASRAIDHQARFDCGLSAKLRAKADETAADCKDLELAAQNKLMGARDVNVNKLQQAIAAAEAKIESCEDEISAINSQRDELVASSERKLDSAAHASARMGVRTHRPARELVYDSAQVALQSEFDGMALAATDLKAAADRCEADAASVTAIKKTVETLLDQKSQCLDLENQCLKVTIM